MNRYVKAPDVISFKDCVNKNYNLSSSLFTKLIISNTNNLPVSSFLTRELENRDLGCEIGSLSYTDRSTHYFLRTKALQKNSFIPDITGESALPMRPVDFVNMNLKKGDLIISKDSNIGEIVILEKDYPNYMLSGAIYKLPVKEEYKYYLFSMIKHDIFREQLDSIVPKGATIRHAKTLFLDCLIPLPNKNTKNVIEYVSKLTKAIIQKETLIKKRHEQILNAIQEELENNQKDNEFKYSMPTYSEVAETGRLDTGIYSEYFKRKIYLIKNYKYDSSNIYDLGFSLSRGQNLQVSNIGESIYTKEKHRNFYTLMLPKFISKYGTSQKIEYLGNKNKLKTLNKGELIFGAEGFEKGRSVVVLEDQDRVITNIHGITIEHKDKNIQLSIFIKLCLDYLRNLGLIDLCAVGGNGGSLAQKYWDVIPFPNFPETKQKDITKLYYNQKITYATSSFTLGNFTTKDSDFNKSAGIYELDKSAMYLKELLNKAIDNIVNDVEVDIKF